ncbi:MAG: hypothetical protein E7497_03220 [Ruminococcus sp.]|nr:hypothetical protein [Ruminococcus sp.]
MLRHKKTAAFLMSLLICAAAIAPSAAFAETTEAATAAQTETAGEAQTEASDEETTDAADDGKIVSGDFTYSLNSDDTANIELYSGSEVNVTVPETIDGHTVTDIAKDAFIGTEVETIEIPACIEYIAGENPFLDSAMLREINVAEGNENYSSQDGILYNKDKTTLLYYPMGKRETSFTIPEGVTSLGIAAFYDTTLQELTFPSTLTEISRHAVSYNERLTKLDMSKTAVSVISDMAFTSCTALFEFIFPEGIKEIGAASFAGCGALKEIDIPETVTFIGQNAFAATGLTRVYIPPSVIDIGYCAFGYDEELKPDDSFVIIGEYGSAAQSYATDSDAEYEYANNFIFRSPDEADAEEAYIDMNVQDYGDFQYGTLDGKICITAYTGTDSVVEIPSEIDGKPVEIIYGGAFFQCPATEIIVPSSVKTLNEISFYMCQSLQKITLPDGLETIKNQAFNDCTALKSIEIPGTVKSIGEEIFFGCTSLEEITVSSAEGGEYCAENGVLYNKDKSVIMAYPAAKKDKKYKAPSTAKEITISAFCDNIYLEEADLSSVEIIGNYCFESCSKLNYVKFSKDLTQIGTTAFYNCTELKSVHLYDKLTKIGDCALGFYYGVDPESETGGYTDLPVEGFRIYAEPETYASTYAESKGFELKSGTFEMFGKNVEKGFIYTLSAIAGVIVLAVIGIFTGKSIKKKKAAKEENTENTSIVENDGGKENNDEAE